jgi:putative sterol carrier protein
VADFLSTEWFQGLNETFESASAPPFEADDATLRVVIEFPDAPNNGPHAITFSIDASGARVESGDHLGADAIMQISYADAAALTAGEIDGASALRDGRVKVRGDINAIVPLLNWLQRAHPSAH